MGCIRTDYRNRASILVLSHHRLAEFRFYCTVLLVLSYRFSRYFPVLSGSVVLRRNRYCYVSACYCFLLLFSLFGIFLFLLFLVVI